MQVSSTIDFNKTIHKVTLSFAGSGPQLVSLLVCVGKCDCKSTKTSQGGIRGSPKYQKLLVSIFQEWTRFQVDSALYGVLSHEFVKATLKGAPCAKEQ